jgi:hypothetical protein
MYKDVERGRDDGKLDHHKLDFCNQQATKDSLDYFWVDTCCIRNAAKVWITYKSRGFRRQKRRLPIFRIGFKRTLQLQLSFLSLFRPDITTI